MHASLLKELRPGGPALLGRTSPRPNDSKNDPRIHKKAKAKAKKHSSIVEGGAAKHGEHVHAKASAFQTRHLSISLDLLRRDTAHGPESPWLVEIASPGP